MAMETKSSFGERIVSLSSKIFKNPLNKKQNIGKKSVFGDFRNISTIKLAVRCPKSKPLL